MKFYGKRIIRNSMKAAISARSETRDAILWDILDEQRVCRVKIQGSNKLIVAHFPQNCGNRTSWMRVGNSVKIMHTGGVRGRIEIVGDGGLIPSPVEGGDAFPDIYYGDDGVLSGCQLIALDPPYMMVGVKAGIYRIAGNLYYLGAYGGADEYIAMGETPPMEMGIGIAMGTKVAYGIAIDPAPASPGHYRYDIIVIGADGVLDYVKGSEFTTTPVFPDVPINHVQLGWILLPYGTTEITNDLINRYWESPVPRSLAFTMPTKTVDYDLLKVTGTITIQVLDQYANPLSPPTGLYWGITYFYPLLGELAQGPETGLTVTTTSSSVTVPFEADIPVGLDHELGLAINATLSADVPVPGAAYFVLIEEP